LIALCDGQQRKALTTWEVGCKKTFPGRPCAIKFTKFRPEMFLDFSARYVFWLSYYAPSQHLNYNIELDLEFDLDLENQNLCSLSWSFREVSQQQIWQDGGFKDFGSDVFHVFTLKTFRSESGFDSKLKVFYSKLWEILRIGVHWFLSGRQAAADLIFVCNFLQI